MIESAVTSAIVTTVGLIVVALVTKRGEAQAKRIEGETPAYEALARRVTRLEAEVEAAMAEQREDRRYILLLLAILPASQSPPQPQPGWLSMHLPPPQGDNS